MLKYFIFFIIVAFLATEFASPLFWIAFRKHMKSPSKEDLNEQDKKKFIKLQIMAFLITAFLPTALTEMGGAGGTTTVFSPVILFAIILFYVFKIYAALILPYKQKYLNQYVIGACIIIILYAALWGQSSFMLDKVNFETNFISVEDVAKVNKENCVLSGEDLYNWIDCHSSENYKICQSNGKIIVYFPINEIFILGKSDLKFVKKTAFFHKYPKEVRGKFTEELGIVIDNDDNPYFIYAIMKRQSLLGSYSIDEYALYDVQTEEIYYYETYSQLPDWAKFN